MKVPTTLEDLGVCPPRNFWDYRLSEKYYSAFCDERKPSRTISCCYPRKWQAPGSPTQEWDMPFFSAPPSCLSLPMEGWILTPQVLVAGTFDVYIRVKILFALKKYSGWTCAFPRNWGEGVADRKVECPNMAQQLYWKAQQTVSDVVCFCDCASTQ